MEQEQINYPWEDAPDWARWAAIDESGDAFWLATKPILGIETWHIGMYVLIASWAIPNIDWKLSLQKRPNT